MRMLQRLESSQQIKIHSVIASNYRERSNPEPYLIERTGLLLRPAAVLAMTENVWLFIVGKISRNEIGGSAPHN